MEVTSELCIRCEHLFIPPYFLGVCWLVSYWRKCVYTWYRCTKLITAFWTVAIYSQAVCRCENQDMGRLLWLGAATDLQWPL